MMSAVIESWPDKRTGLPGKPVHVSNGGRYLDPTDKKDPNTMHCKKEDHFASEKTDTNSKEEVDCFSICLSLPKGSRNTNEDDLPQPQDCWLMRLFESTLFDMSIAIGYLFNSKEPAVQRYLGNRLFVSVACIFHIIQGVCYMFNYHTGCVSMFVLPFSCKCTCVLIKKSLIMLVYNCILMGVITDDENIMEFNFNNLCCGLIHV